MLAPATTEPPDIDCVTPKAWRIISSVFLLTVFFLSVGGNLVVCLLLCRKRSLRAKSSMFVVNLVICDLLSASFAIPLEVVYVLGKEQWLLGKPGYFLSMGTFICFLTMSFLNITAVTVERYVAIKYPLRYPYWVTDIRIRGVILFIWLYSVTITVLLSTTLDPNKFDFVVPDQYYYPFLTIDVLLPITIVSVIYIKLLWIVRVQLTKIKTGHTSVGELSNSRFLKNMKAAKTVGVFFTMLVLAWLPFCIVEFLKFSEIDYCTWDLADTLTLCVTYTNGALNVLVYWSRDKEFRRNVSKMLPCLSESEIHSSVISQKRVSAT